MTKEYLYRGGRILAPIWGKTALPRMRVVSGNGTLQAESRHAIIVAGTFPCIHGVKYEIGAAEVEPEKKMLNIVKTENLFYKGEKWTAFIAEEPLAKIKTA